MNVNRQKNQNDAKHQINVLTRSAIALALSVVCLLLFRGATSIVSAFIIPVVIVLFSKRDEVLSFVYIAISLLMMTVLFFQTQIIFLIPLHDMMLSLSNNQGLRYLGILLMEAIVITVVNLLLLKAVTSRIKLIH